MRAFGSRLYWLFCCRVSLRDLYVQLREHSARALCSMLSANQDVRQKAFDDGFLDKLQVRQKQFDRSTAKKLAALTVLLEAQTGTRFFFFF